MFDKNWILFKKQKIAFEPPFGGLRGNIHAPSLESPWSIPIRYIWTFRHLLRLRHYKRKSVEVGVFEGGGSFWAQISDGRERRPPTTLGVRKLEWLPFRVVSNHLQCIVWFCHKARVWQTDRQTDEQTNRQNYYSQGGASIAASRGKKTNTRTHARTARQPKNLIPPAQRTLYITLTDVLSEPHWGIWGLTQACVGSVQLSIEPLSC